MGRNTWVVRREVLRKDGNSIYTTSSVIYMIIGYFKPLGMPAVSRHLNLMSWRNAHRNNVSNVNSGG